MNKFMFSVIVCLVTICVFVTGPIAAIGENDEKDTIIVSYVYQEEDSYYSGTDEIKLNEDAIALLPLERYLEQLETDSKEASHLLHNAVHTGVFLSNDSWRYGIITEDGMCFLNILLDSNLPDASILSVHILVNKDVNGGVSAIISDLQADFLKANLSIDNHDHWSFVTVYSMPYSHAYQHVYMLSTAVHDRVNIYGEDVQNMHYSLKSDPDHTHMGTIDDFARQFLPEILPDDLENLIDPYTFDDAKKDSPGLPSDELIRAWQQYIISIETVYRIPYQDSFELVIHCHPETGNISYIEIHSNTMGYADLMRQYLAFFFDLAETSYPPETIDLLLLMNGEEFSWRDTMKNNVFKTPVAYFAGEGYYLSLKMDENNIPYAVITTWDECIPNRSIAAPF